MSKEKEKTTPTLDEYITLLIKAKRLKALDKSRNRTSIRIPMIPNQESEEHWKRRLMLDIDQAETYLSRAMAEGNNEDAGYWKDMLDELLKQEEQGLPVMVQGANCMYIAGDCYGLNIPGNQTFAAKHKELGFKKAAKGSMEPGDLVQDVGDGVPTHAMIYDSKDDSGNLLFNYAKGYVTGDIKADYVKQGKYPLPIKDYDVYKYVGTPADSTQWINLYKLIYGLGKGGIIGIPYLKKGSGIHIKKKNRGKFTEYCGGEVTNECILRAKNSKNPKLRKRATFAANARKWKHANGGVFKYLEGTTEGGINTFNPPKMIISEELKELKKTNPLEYSKTMQTMMRLNQRDYARAWYAERYKLDKYKDLLAGNMDQINALLDLDGFVPLDLVVIKLGGRRPVGPGNKEVHGGFVTGDKSIDGKPFWFGRSVGTWWHEGIGHWLGDQIPGLLSKNPGSYLKYLHPEYDYDGYYQLYLNLINENHARTWEFRGLNKHMKDSNGNLYIDPNRQLSPEEVQEMIDKGARIPTNWQDSNIDATKIANFHNTFAVVNKRSVPGFPVKLMAKEGVKIHKPDGHRAITDNGWIPTKRLKKGTYGLIKKK